MKHGILYFLHISKLAFFSRILFIPGVLWTIKIPITYAGSLNFYFVAFVLLDIFMLVMCMMPAPSPKYARNMIRKYEELFDAYISENYFGKVRKSDITILKTWQNYRYAGRNLTIKLDGDVITPNLTFLAVLPAKDGSCVTYEYANYDLCGEERLTRKRWVVTAESAFSVELKKYSEADSRVDLVFPKFGENEAETFVVLENFHLRDFLRPLHALVPQSRDVARFIDGAMLLVRG